MLMLLSVKLCRVALNPKTALKASLETNTESWVSWTLQGNRVNILPSGETLEEAFNESKQLKQKPF
ncbi:MAG: hypothetical protein CM1200mP33_5600 [Chloroflexota bacterium]|nr:MAG: hypothetical protein CM1200mP33_5600 [Chloroflexota bacterium]